MNNAPATTTRKPFTSETLERYTLGTGITRETTTEKGWMGAVDLAFELMEQHPNLDEQTARVLIDATLYGLPVVLTWEDFRRTERDEREVTRTTATVLLQQLHPGAHGSVNHRRWGFSGPIHLRKIVEARSPEADYSFRIEERA